ncbi:hypothetical protein ACFP3I_14835 [Chryseobacterium arachidis]|uniref:hypothetical protein n=1 Tax=Chryseobacterium arachidis TaxID=1416778 RepID=UPI0009341C94
MNLRNQSQYYNGDSGGLRPPESPIFKSILWVSAGLARRNLFILYLSQIAQIFTDVYNFSLY